MLGYYAIYSSSEGQRLRRSTDRTATRFLGLLPHEIGAMSRRRAGRFA